jgi:hypothetical protein
VKNNVLAKTRSVYPQIRNPEGNKPPFVDAPETVAFMAKYQETIDSGTVETFETNCLELRAMSKVLTKYLDRNWWPYREKIVRCWTDLYQHRGIQDTSIVEGTQASVKKCLPNDRMGLLGAFQALQPWWALRVSKLSLAVETSASKTPCLFLETAYYRYYEAVVRVICIKPLEDTHKELQRAEDMLLGRVPRTACKGAFRRVHGRPCVLELLEILQSRGMLRLLPGHFDRHWWVRPSEAVAYSPRVLEPSLQRRRRVMDHPTPHATNHGMYSTRRDPIWSELTDMNHPASAALYGANFTGPDTTSVHAFAADEVDFVGHHRPARYWGYVGQSYLE